MKKRLISTLLAIAMLASLLPTAFAADTVTRAEWISQLVTAFSMTVEDDTTMPDNYFSDITESDSYYRDILLAVEFGVIDLEAGEAFKPTDPATREFAARTLNSCLQFQLDEGAEYTYSEADSVTYPDDIQIAVNRNWFALSGANFLPEQAITSAEATAMLADAKAVIDSEAIDTNYDSKFEFAEGVIVVPETAQTSIDENNTVTITDNETEINAGDVFIVFSSGIPIALKATAVETTDNITVISTTKEGAENAILSVDYESVSEVDLENFVADEVETYSITNTSTDETEEMEIQLYNIGYDEKTKTLKASKNIKVGGGLAGSISVEVKNIKLHKKEDVKNGVYKAYITGDTTITESISFDFGEYAGIPHSILLGIIPIEGIGDVSLTLDISLEGGMTCTEIGKIKSGFCYERYSGFRLIANYTKKEFSYTAEVNLKVGLTLSANINLIVVSGRAWATIGVHGYYKKHRYNDGMPLLCETFGAYLYANYGAKVTITGVDANVFDKKVDIWTEENSPARFYYHYENGAWVNACTRDAENTDARVKYTTSTNSAYFNPSPNRAQGSYGGGGSTAEPVVIWEYKVENDGNATITGYKGNSSAVAVPSKVDGYTVTKIGYGAFRDNNILNTVTLPNTIVKIDELVFFKCKNLRTVKLSSNLESLKGLAFGDCTSLNNIEIPKSLAEARCYNYGEGPFCGCSALKNVTFEEGTTRIIDNLFAGCTGIENINIPDTATEIGDYAFLRCSNLENINIPNCIITIGAYAFYDCTSLINVFIPDSVTKIKEMTFMGCTSLGKVKLSKNLESLGMAAFQDCIPLTTIEIPKSLKSVGRENARYAPFKNTGLKTVIFEEGITKIPSNLLSLCDSLEQITIPDTVIEIGDFAFYLCTNLKNIKISNNTVNIGEYSFNECTSLQEIIIPDSVIDIKSLAFAGCTNLGKVKLSKNLESLGKGAFQDCTKLTTIEIPKSLKSVGRENARFAPFKNTGLKTVIFEDGLTEIPSNLFSLCDSLEEIVIPNTVEKINSFAFYMSAGLKNVALSENLTSIGELAFRECTALTEISLPNSVTEMGIDIFYGCTSLEKVTLPNTIKTIPSGTFFNCKSLTDITLPNTITKIVNGAFLGCESLTNIDLPDSLVTIDNDIFNGCKSLTNITVPKNVTYIGPNAFYDCDALETATINGSGSIGQKAFYDCDALTTLTLSDGITEIGSNMCYGCDSLTNVSLGKYITTIPDSAFRLCQSLTSVTLPRFCTKVAANAFAEDTKLTSAYVPVSVTSIENNSFSYPAKMTMYGKSGSYAEEYANSRNMTFSAVSSPITSMSYADNAVEIGRYAKIRPTLNIEPAFDTSTVTFASSDENICTVSETGEIYGNNYGTATITATSDSGVKTEIAVAVVRLADSVSLDKTELALEAGDTAMLTATLNPSDATDKITWKSSNEKVATVDNGTVTAVGAGTAVITVTSTGGKTASCTVNVTGTFTVTAIAGENGKISPSGDVAVKSDEKKTFNILPDYGYVVKDVLVNGASVGAVETYTFSNFTDNATITAEFAKVDAAYENGTVTISSEAALKDLKLIIATYDEDGRLTDCEIKTVTANAGESYQDIVAEAGNMKLMLWSGLDTMRPIWSNK